MNVLKFLIALLLLASWSCSRKSAVELYTEGRQAEDQQNFRLAVERFDELAGRFQDSPYAESSLTRSAVIYNNELHDIPRSIGAYRQIYTRFPSSKQAPTALFLTAFLYNNDLHKTDSARMAYEDFLRRYPAHELAVSAKFEIENLGKDPSDFMKGDVTSAESGAEKKASKQ